MLFANGMGTVDMSYFNNPPIHLTDDERVLKSLKSTVESSQEGSERKRYLQELYSIGREMMEESGTVMIPALSFILDLDIFKTYPDIIDDIENAYKPSTGILSYRPIIAVGMAALDAYSLENESNPEKEKFLKSLKQKPCEFAASCTDILPQDWDKDALENKILSIAIKYQSEGKRCIFITDNNAQSIKATSLGIPTLNVERLQARLNAIFYYWNERNRILSDEDATEIDWGTLRPDYDYGELDESEYLNFGNIDTKECEERADNDTAPSLAQEPEDSLEGRTKEYNHDFSKYDNIFRKTVEASDDEYLSVNNVKFQEPGKFAKIVEYLVVNEYINFGDVGLFVFRMTGRCRPNYTITATTKIKWNKKDKPYLGDLYYLCWRLMGRVPCHKVDKFFGLPDGSIKSNLTANLNFREFIRSIVPEEPGTKKSKK